MEVETLHRVAFPSQLVSSRASALMSNGVVLGKESSSLPEVLLYPSLVSDCHTFVDNKADSGLTYNAQTIPAPSLPHFLGRKRSRDSSPHLEFFNPISKHSKTCTAVSPFSDEEITFQMHHRHSEINRLVADHTRKMMSEMEKLRTRQYRLLMDEIQEAVTKRLQDKDDELIRLGKLNWALQERVKALSVENQLWRDLAQTNEATANSLRTNLEEVLAHVGDERIDVVKDDVESCCDSSTPAGPVDDAKKYSSEPAFGACRKCGEREPGVLLLPCRHLCLCSSCGSSTVASCPVCGSILSAFVHVNFDHQC